MSELSNMNAHKTSLAGLAIALLLMVFGSACAPTRDHQSNRGPAEILAGKVKVGMTAGTARRTIEEARPGNIILWSDSFSAGLDRYEMGQGSCLLLKYDNLRNP